MDKIKSPNNQSWLRFRLVLHLFQINVSPIPQASNFIKTPANDNAENNTLGQLFKKYLTVVSSLV